VPCRIEAGALSYTSAGRIVGPLNDGLFVGYEVKIVLLCDTGRHCGLVPNDAHHLCLLIAQVKMFLISIMIV
jgi:hypothetical protein